MGGVGCGNLWPVCGIFPATFSLSLFSPHETLVQTDVQVLEDGFSNFRRECESKCARAVDHFRDALKDLPVVARSHYKVPIFANARHLSFRKWLFTWSRQLLDTAGGPRAQVRTNQNSQHAPSPPCLSGLTDLLRSRTLVWSSARSSACELLSGRRLREFLGFRNSR